MKWNQHLEIEEGSHAPFSASGWHWINYDKEKLLTTYRNRQAVERGTRLHEFASECIKLKQHLPFEELGLNMFVNDAIDIGMRSEQLLYYSDFFFGTADAIAFCKNGGKRRPILRVHDLKTGETPAHFEQLLIYAALFCLEYDIKPGEIDFELRIYQFNKCLVANPQADEVAPIMDKIVTFNKYLLKEERLMMKGE